MAIADNIIIIIIIIISQRTVVWCPYLWVAHVCDLRDHRGQWREPVEGKNQNKEFAQGKQLFGQRGKVIVVQMQCLQTAHRTPFQNTYVSSNTLLRLQVYDNKNK